MSAESHTGELPTYYGERTKDGSRVERPSEEHDREVDRDHDSGDQTNPLVAKPPKTYSTRDSAISPRGPPNGNFSRPNVVHEADSNALIQRRSSRRPSSGTDFPLPTNRLTRRGTQHRPRYADYDRYDDYDEQYEAPRRFRSFREREYGRGRGRDYDLDEPRYSRYVDDRPRRPYQPKHVDDYESDPGYSRRHPSTPRAPPREIPSPIHDDDLSYERKGPIDQPVSPQTLRNLKKVSKFQDLSKQERKEILRLPWTQWMNSNFKNRMYRPHDLTMHPTDIIFQSKTSSPHSASLLVRPCFSSSPLPVLKLPISLLETLHQTVSRVCSQLRLGHGICQIADQDRE